MQRDARGAPRPVPLDGLQDRRRAALAQARQRGEPPAAAGLLQAVDVRDPERPPRRGDRLRADALDRERLDDPLRNTPLELVTVRQRPALEELADAGRDPLADRAIEVSSPLRQSSETGLGSVSITWAAWR